MAVQESYFDAHLRAYPGQLLVVSNYSQFLRGHVAETEVFVGRGVVKGAVISPVANTYTSQPAPFNVKAPELTSASADIVGVVVRVQVPTANDATGVTAVVPAKKMATVLSVGSKEVIAVANSVAVIEGQDVFMAVNPTNAANIAVGEFHNVAGAGLITVTDAKWYQSSIANTIGFISLN